MRWIVVAALVAACGGKSVAPAPAPVAGATAESVLGELAAALKADDGARLDALIHPEHGLWVWWQPGAYVVPAVRLVPDGRAPSARLRGQGLNDWWEQELWPTAAGTLARGLTVMDRDPADRQAPIYGDCGSEDMSAERAWLVSKDDLGQHYGDILAEANVTVAPLMRDGLVHFRNWGLDVWMAREGDRWWVAHVMVWTPCDA